MRRWPGLLSSEHDVQLEQQPGVETLGLEAGRLAALGVLLVGIAVASSVAVVFSEFHLLEWKQSIELRRQLVLAHRAHGKEVIAGRANVRIANLRNLSILYILRNLPVQCERHLPRTF